uniref:Uncharacterized protein LOC108038392 n=1 Tax=Drosophila rhopaloa TaxID=1041015 RepID=A0A6P4E2M3_DRORH
MPMTRADWRTPSRADLDRPRPKHRSGSVPARKLIRRPPITADRPRPHQAPTLVRVVRKFTELPALAFRIKVLHNPRRERRRRWQVTGTKIVNSSTPSVSSAIMAMQLLIVLMLSTVDRLSLMTPRGSLNCS